MHKGEIKLEIFPVPTYCQFMFPSFQNDLADNLSRTFSEDNIAKLKAFIEEMPDNRAEMYRN